MKKAALSVASVAVLVVGVAIFFGLSGKDRVSLSAHDTDGTRVIVSVAGKEFLVETAMSVEEQTQGLSERQSLSTGTGMLFIFEPEQEVSFWMYKMNFPLDMIFISGGKVINIERNTPVPSHLIDPDKLPRYSPGKPVSYVLEINAGESAGIKLGDTVNIRNYNQT